MHILRKSIPCTPSIFTCDLPRLIVVVDDKHTFEEHFRFFRFRIVFRFRMFLKMHISWGTIVLVSMILLRDL